uniref:Uncharacterized protein n=1 Tax=Arundo donax TaxID=35708 RepID=A0A0A9A2U1_ARUDO
MNMPLVSSHDRGIKEWKG